MKKKLLVLLLVMLAAFSFTACGKKEEKKEKKEEEKKEEVKEKTEKIKSSLVSDDKKIVFKQEPSTYIVFEHEGETLKSYKEYIDYNSDDSAKAAIKGYEDDVKNKKYESVTSEGQYVVVTHNKSEYETWTLTVVKAAFKNLKEVK